MLAECLAGSFVRLPLLICNQHYVLLVADCFDAKLRGVVIQSLMNAVETPHPSCSGRIQLARYQLFKLKGKFTPFVITVGFGGNGVGVGSTN